MFNKITKYASVHLLKHATRSLIACSAGIVFVFVGLHTAIEKPTPLKTIVTKSTAQHVTTAPKKVVKPTLITTPAVVAPPAPVVKPVTPVTKPATTVAKSVPVVTPAPGSSVSSLTPTPPASSGGSGGSSSPPTTTTSYTSTNWSGYLSGTGTFSAISGSWNATEPTGNGSTTTADGTWIGIGGVTTDDLIQVGTDNTITAGGHVTTSAFYEILPAASVNIPSLTVTPGDSMSAAISKLSGNQWSVTITDNTNSESYNTTLTYASSESSAEWIEEDPSYSATRQIPFDNFGSASFSSALSTMDGSSLNLTGSDAAPITMVNQSDQTIAVPSAIGSDGASFSVTQ
jgi:hypothetical protein